MIKKSFRFAQTRFYKTSRAGILHSLHQQRNDFRVEEFSQGKKSGLKVRQGATMPQGRNPKASRQREELLDCQPPNPKHNSVLCSTKEARAGHSNTSHNRCETSNVQGRLSHIKTTAYLINSGCSCRGHLTTSESTLGSKQNKRKNF